MPSVDLPMAVLFVLFLMLFVAIGIAPALQRTANRLRDFLNDLGKALEPGDEALGGPMPTSFEGDRQPLLLNDFEIFVLRQLAQADRKGLSARQLQAALHFDPPLLRNTLAALLERGLVEVAMTIGFGSRFRLSARGRDFATEQGYLMGHREI